MSSVEETQQTRLHYNKSIRTNFPNMALLRYAKNPSNSSYLLWYVSLGARMFTNLLCGLGHQRLVKALVGRFNLHITIPPAPHLLQSIIPSRRVHLWIWCRLSIFGNIPPRYMVRETEAFITCYMSS